MPIEDDVPTTKKKTKPQEERRPPLDKAKKEAMLAICIRNHEAFESVHELLTVGFVKKWSEPMALVWREVRKFYKKYGELPDRGQLNAELHNETGGNVDLLSKPEQGEIDKFMAYAWDDDEFDPKKVGKSMKYVRQAVDTAKTFLEECVALDLRKTLMREGALPTNVPEYLQARQNTLDQIASLTEIDLDVPFPTGWDVREDNQLFTTGVEALDNFMGGGWRGGETVLFMGPYGSCKTTLVCHGVSKQMKYCQGLLASGKARRNNKGEVMTPVVVLIFTESDKNEYRDRLMSNMAKVPWKRLAQMGGIDTLDDSDEPGATEETQYEKTLFAEQMKKDEWTFKNEQTRVKEAQKLANKHLMIIDCTDAEDNPHNIGKGGITEIANILRGIFRRKKDTHYPVCVWVDHVSGLVDRMAEDMTDDKLIHRMITNIPRKAADKIGKPFNVPVALMHQLSGSVQNKGAVAKYHHNDAEGSKSIAKYAVFAFVSGSVDANGMCKWECTKHRREPPSSVRIVKVNGEFNTLVDCSDTHGVASGQNVIMSFEEMGSVAKVEAGGAPKGMTQKKPSGKGGTFAGIKEGDPS